MNLDLIFTLTSLFSCELCLVANLNRYPADVICLFEFSPLFDPGELRFCWSGRLGRIHRLSRKRAFPRFHFSGAGSAPGRCGSNRAKSGTSIARSENVRAWNDSSNGTGEARRTSYRLRCAGPLPVLQSQNVVRLEFSGSFGLMQRGSGLRSSTAISGDAAERPTGPA